VHGENFVVGWNDLCQLCEVSWECCWISIDWLVFGGIGVWIWGFALTGQMLYHLCMPPVFVQVLYSCILLIIWLMLHPLLRRKYWNLQQLLWLFTICPRNSITFTLMCFEDKLTGTYIFCIVMYSSLKYPILRWSSYCHYYYFFSLNSIFCPKYSHHSFILISTTLIHLFLFFYN
jgi:hypothetical protein